MFIKLNTLPLRVVFTALKNKEMKNDTEILRIWRIGKMDIFKKKKKKQ